MLGRGEFYPLRCEGWGPAGPGGSGMNDYEWENGNGYWKLELTWCVRVGRTDKKQTAAEKVKRVEDLLAGK